jgi:predicted N-acyltransferase
MMDRHLTMADLANFDVKSKIYRSFEVDLTKDEDELFANMTGACRRCIRKAEKSGVTVEEAKDSAFPEEYFAQLQDVFAKQSLVPTYTVERVRQMVSHLYPTGNLLLLRARDPTGRCIATGIFPYLNEVMFFWGGASWRQFQFLRPNEAVQWHAMRFAKTVGLRTYDMGGGGEYKRKYGGHEIEVPWVRTSKFAWVGYMRDLAERIHMARQQWCGRAKTFRAHRPETAERYAQLSQNEQ